MATAAIQGEETDNSSDELGKTLLCQPCKEDNKKLPAIGYCVNCREYLCQRCFVYHLVPSITKKHVLLDKEHVPGIEQNDDDPMCPEHRDEEIKYHCASHSFVGCHICFYKHQKSCKDAIYIPEFFESITISDKLNSINQDIAGVTNKCTETISIIKQKKAHIESHHDGAIAAMKQFKRDILDRMDKLEREVCDKSTKIKEEEILPLDILSKQYQTILVGVQKVKSRIERLQNKEEHQYKAYITIQQSKDAILKIEGKMKGFELDKPVKEVVFKANIELSEMLKSPFGLGSLQMKGKIDKAEHVQDINIKAVNDNSTCACRCSVLLPGNKLIVSDMNNNSIKLVDLKQNKLISDLKFPSYPWGVCAISDSVVAVTVCSEKKIAIVRTGPELSVQREIGVNGTPYGIGCQDDKLVVTYVNPHKVEIMNMQGTVIRTFETDNNRQALFNHPYCVAVNHRNNLIYVSNHGSHNVVSMNYDGTVIGTYKDNSMNNPLQIIYNDSNTGFLCGYTSDNVNIITDDCKKIKVLLTNADGINKPSSISYQENNDQIYIGQNSDSIKVYQLKYTNT